MCQRQTGSAFALNLVIEADCVEILSGDPRPVRTPTDDGRIKTTYRCPSCQVTIFSRSTHPGLRFVRAGTLDNAAEIFPDAHIFTRSKLPWVALEDSVPAFETTYVRETLWPTSSLKRLAALDSRPR